MSTQYRLVQSGKTASGGCSAGQGSSEPLAPRIYFYFFILLTLFANSQTIKKSLFFRTERIRTFPRFVSFVSYELCFSVWYCFKFQNRG
jgi:hypothetical protein